MTTQKFIEFLKSESIEDIAEAMIELQSQINALKRPQEPEQIPMAFVDGDAHSINVKLTPEGMELKPGTNLYTTTPQCQPWVSLTPEIKIVFAIGLNEIDRLKVIDDIEAKLRELNDAPQRKTMPTSANESLTAEESRPRGTYWRCIKCHYGHDQLYCPECGHHSIEKENFIEHSLTDERAAFETWYCADAMQQGVDLLEGIAHLRNGDHYGEYRAMLNGKWEAWKARSNAVKGD